jgi:hypothetical protein
MSDTDSTARLLERYGAAVEVWTEAVAAHPTRGATP